MGNQNSQKRNNEKNPGKIIAKKENKKEEKVEKGEKPIKAIKLDLEGFKIDGTSPLEKLPRRLFEYLATFCSIPSIGKLSQCSKSLYKLMNSAFLWKNLCLRDDLLDDKELELPIGEIKSWKSFYELGQFEWDCHSSMTTPQKKLFTFSLNGRKVQTTNFCTKPVVSKRPVHQHKITKMELEIHTTNHQSACMGIVNEDYDGGTYIMDHINGRGCALDGYLGNQKIREEEGGNYLSIMRVDSGKVVFYVDMSNQKLYIHHVSSGEYVTWSFSKFGKDKKIFFAFNLAKDGDFIETKSYSIISNTNFENELKKIKMADMQKAIKI